MSQEPKDTNEPKKPEPAHDPPSPPLKDPQINQCTIPLVIPPMNHNNHSAIPRQCPAKTRRHKLRKLRACGAAERTVR
jgi:hypothetical protein